MTLPFGRAVHGAASLLRTSMYEASWEQRKSLRFITIELQVHLLMFAHLLFSYVLSDVVLIYENECVSKSEGRGMMGGIVRKVHNSALFRPLDLIEYSALNYATTQTNISYRQSCILCEMHLKFDCGSS